MQPEDNGVIVFGNVYFKLLTLRKILTFEDRKSKLIWSLGVFSMIFFGIFGMLMANYQENIVEIVNPGGVCSNIFLRRIFGWIAPEFNSYCKFYWHSGMEIGVIFLFWSFLSFLLPGVIGTWLGLRAYKIRKKEIKQLVLESRITFFCHSLLVLCTFIFVLYITLIDFPFAENSYPLWIVLSSISQERYGFYFGGYIFVITAFTYTLFGSSLPVFLALFSKHSVNKTNEQELFKTNSNSEMTNE